MESRQFKSQALFLMVLGVFLVSPSFAEAQSIVRPASPAGTEATQGKTKKKVIPIKTFSRAQDTSDIGKVALDEPQKETPNPAPKPAKVESNNTPVSFANWPQKSIRDIRIDIRDTSPVVPRDRSGQLTQSNVSDWTTFYPGQKVFAWKAPNIKYQPLYFEDISIERYGQDRGDVRQFAASSFHFFKSAVFLPYAMVADQPKSCDYPLGFCRPGNVAPTTLSRHWYGLPRRR